MTIEQKQHLLAYLGYYTIEVDGIWGKQSKQATGKFQRAFGLEPDGVFGEATEKAIRHAVCYGMPELGEPEEPEAEAEKTGTFWDEIEFFEHEEFICTCGGRGCDGFPEEPCERLVRNLEQTRKHFGRPCRISSGVRCQLRNSELPGSAGNSLHMRGKAADFCILGLSAQEVLAYVKTLPDVHEAYAIDDSFVHMGVLKY